MTSTRVRPLRSRSTASLRVKTVIAYAEGLGLPAPAAGSAERWLTRMGDPAEVRLLLAEYAIVARAIREGGREPTLTEVAQAWSHMGRDALVVARRIRRRDARRATIGTRRPCSAPLGPDENQQAECACSRCVEQLAVALTRYTTRVAYSAFGRWSIPVDEARGELALMLYDALASWPGERSFAAWYGSCARVQFQQRGRALARTPRTIQLDEGRVAA